MPSFTIGRKDTSPSIQATLKDGAGTVVDLTSATVKFLMATKAASAYKVNANATIVGAATNGVVKYSFSATDTDTAGTFDASFRVTFASGLVETVPNAGRITVQVTDDPLA